MIGTLLDDISAGMSISAVKARFGDKMNPTKYQRPTAVPSVANVRMAEKAFEALGLADSLKRRFARIDKIEKVWAPEGKTPDTCRNGMFASIITKEDRASAPSGAITPGITMTWEKFMRKILPNAVKVEYYVEYGSQDFAAILTAADETASPIIQRDSEDRRNTSPGICIIRAPYLLSGVWRAVSAR